MKMPMVMSSYQGGHVEYFKYMVDLLKEAGAAHIKVFAGGGGVIVPQEIKGLEEYGVEKITVRKMVERTRWHD